MKSMKLKSLLASVLILSALPAFARLDPDFYCESVVGKHTLEVKILNFDFAREAEVKFRGKTCRFNIHDANYSRRSAGAAMIINLSSASCPTGADVRFLQDGFLKIRPNEARPKAHTLVLVGHDTLDCEIKSFKRSKLEERIGNFYK